MTDTAAPTTAASAAPAAPVAAPSAPARPSVLHRALAVEQTLVHDPLVDKAGKALVVALVVRGLVALGAGAGVVAVAEHALHAAGL